MAQTEHAPVDPADLAALGVEFVRLAFLDYSGILRGRVFSTRRFQSIIPAGTGLTPGSLVAMQPAFDSPAPGSGVTATGELQIVPDLSSMRILPHRPNHALVFANVFDKEEPDVRHEFCPRGFLSKQLQRLRDTFGLTLMAGVELEFVLLRQNLDAVERVESSVYAELGALRGHAGRTFEKILKVMAQGGMDPWIAHSEGADGQYEVVLEHGEAMKIADDVVVVKDLIRDVADAEGLRVTFCPKVFDSQPGSGAHIHMSLADAETGKNVFPSSGSRNLSPVARSFMAGILQHLVPLSLITLPSNISYARVLPNCWAGAFACWGWNNKEAALNVPGKGPASNVEVKCVDGTANIYLALGAIVAAGIYGLENKLDLPEPVQDNPADKTRADVVPLPRSQEEAIAAFENSAFLKECLGKGAFRAFLATRKYESEVFSAMKPEECRLLYTIRY